MAKILVQTYQPDMLQFEMFCHCLNKNWQDDKNITVIVGQPNADTVIRITENIIKSQLSSDWSVDLVNGTISTLDGLTEHAVNKVKYSNVDTLICDAKDFLLRPSNIQDYKSNSKYCVNFYFPDKTHLQMYDNVQELNAPAVSSMTPWIWSPAVLDTYVEWLEKNYGHHKTWNMFPGGFEYCTWFVWAWNQPHLKELIETDPSNCSLRFGGVWPGQSAQGAVQEVKDFVRWSERKWWKHTRKVQDPICLDLTCDMLIQFDINIEYVLDWKKRKVAEATSLTVG